MRREPRLPLCLPLHLPAALAYGDLVLVVGPIDNVERFATID